MGDLSCDNWYRHQADAAMEASLYTKWVVLMAVGTPLIISGIFGNALSFIVLQSNAFRKLPSSHILSALALVDTGVLLTGMLRHCVLGFTGGAIDIRSYSPASCKTHMFLTFCLMQISSWTLVLVTTARLISIMVPHRAHLLCSRRRLLLALSMVIASLVLLNSHMFFTVDTNRNCFLLSDGNVTAVDQCLPKAQYRTLWGSVWPWVDNIVCSLLPGVIILGENIAIVTRMWVAKRTRESTLNACTNRQQRSSRSVTIMLVGISVLFIVTNIPTVAYFFHFEALRHSYTSTTVVFHVSAILTLYCNHAFNFVIYCVFGRARFGRELLALLSCLSERERRLQSKSTTSTTLASRQTQDKPPRGGLQDHLATDTSPHGDSVEHLGAETSPQADSLDHSGTNTSPQADSLEHLAIDSSPPGDLGDHMPADISTQADSLEHLAADG